MKTYDNPERSLYSDTKEWMTIGITWKKVDQTLYSQGKFGQTYSVSNTGEVRNDKTGRILKSRPNNKGYLRVNLSGKDYKVHRLVALTFLPNPDNLPQVNHEDGNKSNNFVSNLKWCDNSYNQKHAYENGLHSHKGEKNTKCKITDEEVLIIWKSKMTAKEIEEKYNVSNGYAYRLKNKKTREYLLE